MDGYVMFFFPFRIVTDEAVKGLVRAKEGFRFFRIFFLGFLVWICTSFGSICMDFCRDLGEVGCLFFLLKLAVPVVLPILWALQLLQPPKIEWLPKQTCELGILPPVVFL